VIGKESARGSTLKEISGDPTKLGYGVTKVVIFCTPRNEHTLVHLLGDLAGTPTPNSQVEAQLSGKGGAQGPSHLTRFGLVYKIYRVGRVTVSHLSTCRIVQKQARDGCGRRYDVPSEGLP
jgi:hypothetical protein